MGLSRFVVKSANTADSWRRSNVVSTSAQFHDVLLYKCYVTAGKLLTNASTAWNYSLITGKSIGLLPVLGFSPL